MIVREEPDAFVLVEQHEHDQISGEFARHWREHPRPFEPTIYAIANHDLAWQEIDKSVRWNQATGKPYAFTNYPTGPKLRAYSGGLDLLESHSPYAACLCSMHYTTLVQGSGDEEVKRFEESETKRQQRLKKEMSAEELDNLEHNLQLLKLCDGLSLFVCLNEPGETTWPPPYPNGFELAGQRYEPVWEDRSTFRLDPNPFSEPFDLVVPYTLVKRNGSPAGSNHLELRVIC